MKVINEIHAIFDSLHQDVMVLYSTPDALAQSIVDGFRADRIHHIKACLDDLTSGRYHSDDLKRIASKSRAQIFFKNGKAAFNFLKLIREKLD